jgi:hypothetical protein
LDIVKSSSWIILLLFVAGLIVLLMPDSGPRVFGFNQEHGPSQTDLYGLAMILGAWFYSCIIMIQTWNKIRHRLGKKMIFSMVLLYLISIAGIAAALLISSEGLLWPSVIAATSVNTVVIVFALIFAKR